MIGIELYAPQPKYDDAIPMNSHSESLYGPRFMQGRHEQEEKNRKTNRKKYIKRSLFKNSVWSAAGVVIGFLVGSGFMNGDSAKTFVSEPISALLKSGGIITLVVLFSGLAVLFDRRSKIRPIALDEIRGTIQSFISLFLLATFYKFTEEIASQHIPSTTAQPWKMAIMPLFYLTASASVLFLMQLIMNYIPKPEEY